MIQALNLPQENRSAILALVPKKDAAEISNKLAKEGVIMTARGGYLRFAPHFYNSEDQIVAAIDLLNGLAHNLPRLSKTPFRSDP